MIQTTSATNLLNQDKREDTMTKDTIDHLDATMTIKLQVEDHHIGDRQKDTMIHLKEKRKVTESMDTEVAEAEVNSKVAKEEAIEEAKEVASVAVKEVDTKVAKEEASAVVTEKDSVAVKEEASVVETERASVVATEEASVVATEKTSEAAEAEVNSKVATEKVSEAVKEEDSEVATEKVSEAVKEEDSAVATEKGSEAVKEEDSAVAIEKDFKVKIDLKEDTMMIDQLEVIPEEEESTVTIAENNEMKEDIGHIFM